MIAISVILRIGAVLILVPKLDNDCNYTVSDMFREFVFRMKMKKSEIRYWWKRRRE
jgi:ABC-type polysaccharide transport system permease subunit